jgi:branched-chain amino acid transport system substrate-binding protein
MKKTLSMLLCLAMIAGLMIMPATAMAAATGAPVKIGALAPMTGSLATYGESTTNGIKLAIDEINAAGGVLGGRPIELTILDDKGDPTEGANAFNKLVSDGNKAIIGSVTSGVTVGLGELAESESMLLLTATGTADAITDGKTSVFRACYKDSYQGSVCAKLALDLGVKKVAILYASGSDYSAGLYDSFKKTAEEIGLEIVATESSSATTDTDFTTQLTNIVASGAELIFAPYYYDSIGPYIVPQARAAGFTGAFVGADGWDGTQNTMVEDKSLYNNCYFTNHYAPDDPSPVVQGFIAKYTEKFGAASLTALAALGYDAGKMLAQAINAAGTDDTAAIVAAMTGMSFSGVTGSFTLDETGTPIKQCAVLTYKDGAASFYKYIG